MPQARRESARVCRGKFGEVRLGAGLRRHPSVEPRLGGCPTYATACFWGGLVGNAFPQEAHQFSVHFVRVGPNSRVRPVFCDNQARSLNQLGGSLSRGGKRHNPVRTAVNDQRGNVNPGHVLAEILMPSGHACKTGGSGGSRRNIPARLDSLLADPLTQEKIGVVEILEKLGEERVAVRGHSFLNALEDAAVHALRVIRRFQQEWRNTPIMTALLTFFDPYLPT